MKSMLSGNSRAAGFIFVLGLAACSTIINPVQQASDGDARLIMTVKSALIKDPETDAAPIRVRIQNGAVILDGFVESKSARNRAERLARKSADGRKIENRLQLR